MEFFATVLLGFTVCLDTFLGPYACARRLSGLSSARSHDLLVNRIAFRLVASLRSGPMPRTLGHHDIVQP